MQFENLKFLKKIIKLVNENISEFEEIETVILSLKNNILQFHNIIYASVLEINLLNKFQLKKHKFHIIINEKFYIQKKIKFLLISFHKTICFS